MRAKFDQVRFEGSNLKNLQAGNKRHGKILGENKREFNQRQTPKIRRKKDMLSFGSTAGDGR